MNEHPWTVYTLHACVPNAAPIHYTGIVKTENLFRRLSAHMHGYGSKFTKKFYLRGASWHLVKLHPAPTMNEEWIAKAAWRPRSMCPLCQTSWRPPDTRHTTDQSWKPPSFIQHQRNRPKPEGPGRSRTQVWTPFLYCQDTIAVKESPDLRTAVTLRCRSWSCPDCNPIRHKQLVAEAVAGKPRLFITLTSRRRPNMTPAEAAARLARAWRILRLRIMRKYKWTKLPFIAVFEATKLGWPHIHILARCAYIDARWVSAQMQEIDDSPIVKIVALKNVIQSVAYCAKYCGKGTGKFGKSKRYWQSQDYDLRPPPPQHDDHHHSVRWERRQLSLYQWIVSQAAQGWMAQESGNGKAVAWNPRKKVSPPEGKSPGPSTQSYALAPARPPGKGP